MKTKKLLLFIFLFCLAFWILIAAILYDNFSQPEPIPFEAGAATKKHDACNDYVDC